MPDFNQYISGFTGGFATVGYATLIIVGIVVAIILLLLGVWAFWYFKKRFNLDVEIKLPRSDGKLVMGEWGKGLFNPKRGVVLIKRPKKSPVAMKVMDIKRYLQGNTLLSVVQVGPEQFLPVLNDSYQEYIVEYIDEKGNTIEQKEAIINLKLDIGEYKAWQTSWDSASKRAYSLSSFFQQFQTPIAIAIVLVAVFVGFAIIWGKLPTKMIIPLINFPI